MARLAADLAGTLLDDADGATKECLKFGIRPLFEFDQLLQTLKFRVHAKLLWFSRLKADS
jgi:hypothetical protein